MDKMVSIYRLKKRLGKSTKLSLSEKYKMRVFIKREKSWLSNPKRLYEYSL